MLFYMPSFYIRFNTSNYRNLRNKQGHLTYFFNKFLIKKLIEKYKGMNKLHRQLKLKISGITCMNLK